LIANSRTVLDAYKDVWQPYLEMKQAQLGKQTNAEHGEENVQMKAHAYVHR